MNHIDELHALVRDLRLHITQEYPDLQLVEKPVAKKAIAPAAPIVKAAIPPKQESAPIVAKPAPAPIKPKVKEAEIPKTPLEPIMQALCRPFTKPAMTSLLDCIEKLEKLGVQTVDAPVDTPVVVQTELIMVSFFAPGSDEEKFIQKVAESVHTRLGPCSLYMQPGLSAAAFCFTLAASAKTKAIVLAYSQGDAQKLKQWLAYFGDDLKENDTQKSLISSKRALFTAPIYDLVVTPAGMSDAANKRALWNDLQSLI